MTRSLSSHLWIGVLALLVVTAFGLVSCGPDSRNPTGEPSRQGPTVTVPVDLPITISIAGRFANQTLAVLDEQIAAYEEADPAIRIEVVRAPRDPVQRRKWVEDRLTERDTSIDIYVLDATWPAELAVEGGLMRLGGRLAVQGVQPDAFLDSAVEANTFDGHLVALPWTVNSGLLYYRRDILEKYDHLPPASWEELQRISLGLKARETMPHGFVWSGAADEDLTCNTLEHYWSRGSEQIDASGESFADGTQIREALEQMKGLLDSGASPKDVATYDQRASRATFRKGEAIFLRDWFNAWEDLNNSESPVAGQTGLAPLPAGCLGGQSLGLSAYSLHPDEAFQFMTFLTGYDQQVQLATPGGQLPSLEAVYYDETVLAKLPILETLRAALSVARPRPSVADYTQVSESVYSEVHRMLAGKQGVVTTAENMERGIEKLVR